MEKRTILHSKWTLLKSPSRYRNNHFYTLTSHFSHYEVTSVFLFSPLCISQIKTKQNFSGMISCLLTRHLLSKKLYTFETFKTLKSEILKLWVDLLHQILNSRFPFLIYYSRICYVMVRLLICLLIFFLLCVLSFHFSFRSI